MPAAAPDRHERPAERIRRCPVTAAAVPVAAWLGVAVAFTAWVVVSGATAWAGTGTPARPVASCTPRNPAGCNGTDDPSDPSTLMYCGPDNTCTPVAQPSGYRSRHETSRRTGVPLADPARTVRPWSARILTPLAD
jgi:hypothetical protein